MTESCVDFWYDDTIGGENKAGHHMILDVDIENSAMRNGSKWLAGRCEHSWVSLRRICTDELAGSSFRAVRASQESVNELRTSNELWISFFVSKETSQIRKSDPRLSKSMKSMWPYSHLFPWNPSRLIVQSCGEGSDLLGRETNKHPKCSDHQNVFASTLGH